MRIYVVTVQNVQLQIGLYRETNQISDHVVLYIAAIENICGDTRSVISHFGELVKNVADREIIIIPPEGLFFSSGNAQYDTHVGSNLTPKIEGKISTRGKNTFRPICFEPLQRQNAVQDFEQFPKEVSTKSTTS